MGRYVLQEAQQFVHNTYNIERCEISIRISIYYTEISDTITQLRYKCYVYQLQYHGPPAIALVWVGNVLGYLTFGVNLKHIEHAET